MSAQANRPKILIVDDSSASIRVLHETFRKTHDIFIANNGEDALYSVAGQKPDLILLDVMMPDMDGYEVLERLRADPETREIPVIFITALNAGPEEIKGLDSGAVDYITKPIQPALVAARVRNQLELSQRRRMLEELLAERERMMRDLKKSRDASEYANQAKNAFLSTMSHEIRTPMNAIIGMTDLALKTGLSAEQRQYLNIVLQAGESLLGMLNNILDFTRLEGGKMEMSAILFDPLEVMENACETFSVRAHHKKLDLVHEVEPDVPGRLLGDPFRLRQSLVNLIDNAIKFTSDGAVVVRLFVDPDQPTQRPGSIDPPALLLHWTVSDSGIGVPEENREIIFERFVQGESFRTRKYSGAGLGLAISREVTVQLGGRLWVESPGENQGSVFHMTIPYPVPPESWGHTFFTTEAPFSGLQVLLSEPNRLIRARLQRILGMCGATVVVSDSCGRTRELLAARDPERPFQILLLACDPDDTEMVPLAAWMNEHPGWGGKTIIMLPTGMRRYDIPGCREMAVSSGLIKPIKRFRLLRAINTALNPKLVGPDREARPATTTPDAEAPLLVPELTKDIELKRRRFQFLEAAMGPLEKMTAAMMRGRIGDMVQPVHWLQGQAADIAARRLEQSLQQLAAAIEMQDPTDVAFRFEHVQDTFRETTDLIANTLSS